MNKLILRTILIKHRFQLNCISGLRLKSDDSDSGDKRVLEKQTDEKKRSQEALNKLNNLLNDIIKENVSTSQTNLKLAKPEIKNKHILRKTEASTESVQLHSEKNIVNVVKNVAETIGGDVKQTESELLMKLLDGENAGIQSLTDIVKGMKIDRKTNTGEDMSRAVQVKKFLQKTQSESDNKQIYRPQMASNRVFNKPVEKIDLFGQKPLGIFNAAELKDRTEGPVNEIWDFLHKKELKLTVTHPPTNYFQEMSLWTDQGKLWKFPIDNEQGLEKEQNVCFTEHVFLDKHLEGWCPQKGPIRHFMELVCVGLSKNPYLTVEAKKEHIDWFRKYFDDKKQLLKEVGALQGLDTQKNKLVEG